jgi:hypothetical protein
MTWGADAKKRRLNAFVPEQVQPVGPVDEELPDAGVEADIDDDVEDVVFLNAGYWKWSQSSDDYNKLYLDRIGSNPKARFYRGSVKPGRQWTAIAKQAAAKAKAVHCLPGLTDPL